RSPASYWSSTWRSTSGEVRGTTFARSADRSARKELCLEGIVGRIGPANAPPIELLAGRRWSPERGEILLGHVSDRVTHRKTWSEASAASSPSWASVGGQDHPHHTERAA